MSEEKVELRLSIDRLRNASDQAMALLLTSAGLSE
jgi:hypothetical protein